MMNKCIFCYEPVNEGEAFYHARCHASSCISGIDPVIPYSLDQMHNLATKVIGERITVTGVQPKISLNSYQNAGEKSRKLTIINYPGAYILKPPSPAYEELPENEDLTMKLARLSGIVTVPFCLVRLQSGEPAYISQRIDRQGDTKIHMEDMCQLSDRLTEDKYKASVESIGKIIHRHSENMMLDLINFFELALFSFLTGNSDMHLKNYSFIYHEGSPRLAPAYDLLNTKIVVKEDNEESALTINGKKNRITRDDFNALAKHFKIPDKSAENIYRKLSALKPDYLQLIEKSFLSDSMKEAYSIYLEGQFEKIAD